MAAGSTYNVNYTNPQSTTILLGGIQYLIPPSPVSRFRFRTTKDQIKPSAKVFPRDLIPFSVITTDAVYLDQPYLQRILDIWRDTDDVWTSSFLTGIFFSPASSTPLTLILISYIHLVQWNLVPPYCLATQRGKPFRYSNTAHFQPV